MYEFRVLDVEAKRGHLLAQLRQSEWDLYVHTTSAQLAEIAGNTNTAEEQHGLAAAAEKVATLVGELLDELPPEHSG